MENKRTALITGASQGLGLALATALAKTGWNLLINARNAKTLLAAKNTLSQYTQVIAISGDVRDEIHLLQLAEALQANHWTLDLVVNNASALGVSPMPNLLDHPIDDLHVVFHTNIIAPISLLQKIKTYLNANAKIINVSSDTGVEAYETWGAYGGSKAALDHITAIMGKENPQFKCYAFDPGDMRTSMHQAAFPNEDISDRPLPTTHAVPALLTLIADELPSGRYTSNSLIPMNS
ncbi:MAG: SDR family oxidoreductase [Flammeovirgaceae bacterium]